MRILVNSFDIRGYVNRISEEISKNYLQKDIPIVLLGVLNGSVIFLSDLCRALSNRGFTNIELQFIKITTYNGEVSTYSPKIESNIDLKEVLHNKFIFIVEDILDSGKTISFLLQELSSITCKGIDVVALVHRYSFPIKYLLKYTSIEIQNEFIIGYGMDYNGKYRELPFIGVIENENRSITQE